VKKPLLLLAALLLGGALPAVAAGNHAELIAGPFKTGPDVTRKCLECHEKQAKDFMKTPHWTWKEDQVVDGKRIAFGKINAINNFCIALPTNEPRCTSCHAGYGWKDASFDFSKAENVDCLVCHDTTGTYKKFPSGAGHPVYEGETKEFPPGKPWAPVDLLKVAQNVGKPSRATCGACHFYGGGGDHIKHGDLDSSMTNPTADLDVHMGRGGMVCEGCHRATNHVIKGESLLIAGGGDGLRVQCTDCHKPSAHEDPVIVQHTKKVSCQTCHIPAIAKSLPTKVWWDWSKAGQDIKVDNDAFGQKTYDRMKGEFRWNKDFAPTVMWYDGTVKKILPGEKINPKQPVWLVKPLGDRKNPNAKLTPFKIMAGKQPYDSGNSYAVYINLFGPQGYWKTYDWSQSIANGMKAANLPYSGKYDFFETRMAWKVNHMVAPKDKALTCDGCHGEKSRLDWKALGYNRDPKPAQKQP
jgi:octaheme c-type cytochrome (tetrathionate reductase family)